MRGFNFDRVDNEIRVAGTYRSQPVTPRFEIPKQKQPVTVGLSLNRTGPTTYSLERYSYAGKKDLLRFLHGTRKLRTLPGGLLDPNHRRCRRFVFTRSDRCNLEKQRNLAIRSSDANGFPMN